MIRVSACMIVKNEATVLARGLDCLKGIADEMIIVDTGSTDSTKAIAARYTDKILDFPWNGDFSAARNFAFSHAAMDYIYSADADEIIDEENRRRFLELKQTLPPEAEIVQMKYANQLQFNTTYNFDTEYRPKLFKRLRTFRWVDPVHEMVELNVQVVNSEVSIIHSPVGSHAARDLSILGNAAKKGPLSSRLHRMYAKELFISGTQEDFTCAYPYFESVLHDENRSVEDIRAAQCVVIHTARVKGDFDSLMKTALKNVISTPCAEVCCELGAYYWERKDYEEAAVWYYTAAFGAESELEIHSSGDKPLKRLSECYEKLGLPNEAENYKKQAENWTPPKADGK